MIFLFDGEDRWTEELQAFQACTIDGLRAEGLSDERVIEILLDKPNIQNNASFGVGEFARDYSKKFGVEFKRFVCGDEKYEDLRKQVTKDWDKGKMFIISSIAAALAAALGVAVGVLVPVVAVALSTVSRLGANAWCELVTE